jgi:hypothetical protein
LESKSERFKRLAERRTRRILNEIRILSNLSNKSLYEFSPEQLKKIFAAIRESIGEAEARFKGDPKGGAEFKL